MKFIHCLTIASAALSVSIPETHGQITQRYTLSGLAATVPDNSFSGITSSQTISDMPGQYVTKIEVELTLSGGAIGDIYAVLRHDNNTSVVLLNQPGTGDASLPPDVRGYGYSNPGLDNVRLGDSAANGSIDLFVQQLIDSGVSLSNDEITGVKPLSATWGSWAPTGQLSRFNDETANGTWDLKIYDFSEGLVSKLDSWTLDITAVPEPQLHALVCSIGLAGFGLYRRFKK